MNLNQTTFDNLANAVSRLSLPVISKSEAEAIVDLIGVQRLQGYFSAARSGDNDAKTTIHQAILASKVSHFLQGADWPQATIGIALRMVEEHGFPKVRAVMGQAGDGDPNAVAIINEWLQRAAGGSRDVGDDGLGKPLHRTDLPPPGDQEPMRAPARSQTYDNQREPTRQEDHRPQERLAHSQRQPAQAYRSQPRDAGQERRTPQTRSNVAQFPANGNRGHQEQDRVDDDFEPTSDNYRPQDEGAGQRGSGNGGSHGETPRTYDEYTCFGRETAVQFQRTPDKKGVNTVNIKIARAKNQSQSCRAGVDWSNATIVMLVAHEVQIAYAVLMGLGDHCRFAGHGHDNQKWFQFEENKDNFAGSMRLTVGQGANDTRRINISHTDIKGVLAVFSRTLQDQGKGQSAFFIMSEVRRAHELYLKKSQASGNRDNTRRNAQR